MSHLEVCVPKDMDPNIPRSKYPKKEERPCTTSQIYPERAGLGIVSSEYPQRTSTPFDKLGILSEAKGGHPCKAGQKRSGEFQGGPPPSHL